MVRYKQFCRRRALPADRCRSVGCASVGHGMTRAYYNENDPRAAAWLRELIKQGHIAAGDVDTRSIVDVTPNDLDGYTQCHFFAGIGGWSLALRYAGWPDSRPVWTGSCPCQPFSSAGEQAGFIDERHLWPAWFWLIRQRKPVRVYGEQVASAAGRAWFDFVSLDMEALGYAIGSHDLCAAGVGAPHIRQRLYWMADSDSARWGERPERDAVAFSLSKESEPRSDAGGRGVVCHAGVALGDPDNARSQGRGEQGNGADKLTTWPAGVACDWVACTDGKRRPIESGTFPLAYGISTPVVELRGYGNAIVPQLAAAFIESTSYAD